MDVLTRGQVARRSGVGAETVRFYERRGLIEKPPRTASGYRQFPQEVVPRIRFIKRAQQLGFSLREIKELLALRVDSRTTCAEVRQRTQTKIADIEERIRELQRMKRALVRLVAACQRGGGPVSQCPILESLQEKGSNP